MPKGDGGTRETLEERLRRCERRLAEYEAGTTEAAFGLLEALPYPVAVQKRDRAFVWSNSLFNENFFDPGCRTCWEGFHAREEPCESCGLDKLYSGRGGVHSTLTDLQGRRWLVEAALWELRGEQLMIRTFQDITELEQARRRLAESEELHRVTLESISDAVFLTDDQGAFVFVCPNVDVIFRRSVEEVLDLGTLSALFGNEDCSPARLGLRDELANIPCEIVDEEGGRRSLLVTLKRVRIRDGTVLVTCRDVSDRSLAEERNRIAAERVSALLRLSEMRDAGEEELAGFVLQSALRLTGSEFGVISAVDEESMSARTLSWSEGVLEICRVQNPKHHALLGAGIWPRTMRARKPFIINAYGAGEAVGDELPQGHAPLRRLMGLPLLEQDRVELICVLANKNEDYNEMDLKQVFLLLDGLRKHLNARRWRRDLERARSRAEAANRSKSEFLASMSHEIRTPLNGLMGMLQLLEMQPLSPECAELVDAARFSGRSLLSVVNDVLDLSRIEAGKISLEESETDLTELLKRTVRAFRPQAGESGVALEGIAGERALRCAVVDATRLGQVLNNLIGNALKFTSEGYVRVRLDTARDPLHPQRVLVHFSVADTGSGISRKDRERIFEPFSQASGRYRGKRKGSGLGLSIVDRLVRCMGGRVRLHSRPGAGTTVEFHVAGKVCDGRSGPEPVSLDAPGARLQGVRILVVEDDRVNRMTTARLLEKQGATAHCAPDGGEALRLLARRRFDVVLMDVQLPGMDGLEVCARIRRGEEGVLDPKVPVVALTAFALSGNRDRFLASGMDGYLSKPVELDELCAQILAALSARR